MKRIIDYIFRKVSEFFIFPKRIVYFILSENKLCRIGNLKVVLPLVTKGKGDIFFGEGTVLGVLNSPGYLSSYNYIEARNDDSSVSIGCNCILNNNISIISDSGKIDIGDDVLIGFNVNIINSDFHQLEKDKRKTGTPSSQDIRINNNVFIGSNASILKGVSIGENSIVGMGSVVVRDIPKNAVVAGNPAKIIRYI
ncbi:TPA: acyltransferase [Vibrio harveyi]|nr:acyltransferase [Vibrio harveyi]